MKLKPEPTPGPTGLQQQSCHLPWLGDRNRSTCGCGGGEERCSCQTELTAALPPQHRVSGMRANEGRTEMCEEEDRRRDSMMSNFLQNLLRALCGLDAKFKVCLGRATGIQINANNQTTISIWEEEQESDDHMTYRETEVEPLVTKYFKKHVYLFKKQKMHCRATYKTRNLFEVLNCGFWPPTGSLCVHLFSH